MLQVLKMWAGYEGNNLLARMPNGVNWYRGVQKSDFVELTLPYLEKEEDRTEIIRRLNLEFTMQGSTEHPVFSLILSNDKKLIPVAQNAYPFAVYKNSVRWEKFIQDNFSKEGLLPIQNEIEPIISPAFLGEPDTTTIAMPWLKNAIEAEYIAKAGYMEACLTNQWLIPYANRLGWRFVDGTATITIPYWTGMDIQGWWDVIYKGPSSSGFLMSDGKRYPYPDNIAVEIPDVITGNKDIFVLDGVQFNVQKVTEYPQTNRKQKSVARIAQQIRDGMVPFDPPYPIVELSDAHIRIQAKENKDLAIVYLEPNNTILGTHHVKYLTKALEVYRRLWREGELLNDYGHFHYSDSYSELDERGINFIHLSDNDL